MAETTASVAYLIINRLVQVDEFFCRNWLIQSNCMHQAEHFTQQREDIKMAMKGVHYKL